MKATTTITLTLIEGTWDASRLDHGPGWASGELHRASGHATAEAALAAVTDAALQREAIRSGQVCGTCADEGETSCNCYQSLEEWGGMEKS